MTATTTAGATVVALLAGAAFFIAPATAQNAQHQANISSSHARHQFKSSAAAYQAGLRRGTADSYRSTYLRGFSDGTSTQAYGAPGYVVNAEPRAQILSGSAYSSYDRNAAYYTPSNGYPSHDGRYASYDNNNAYITDRYDNGYAPRGLMDVAIAPVVQAQASDAQIALWSYCTARYRTFDLASGTFLANDGNRYFCR
jgi:hypothetical protein